MSLINEALKKAQKQRTGDSPPLAAMPGVGGEPAARIARRAKPVGFNAMLLRIGFGAGGAVVLLIAGIFLVRVLKNRPEAPPPAKISPPATAPAAVTAPVPASVTPAAPSTSTNTFVLPLATPAPAVVQKNEPVAAKVEPQPVSPPPEVAPPKPVAPAPKMNPKAIAYIENLHIAGIRASSYDSKVLMNDHVYRIGDLVDPDLGIKITGITSSSLTFKDDRGAGYTRQF